MGKKPLNENQVKTLRKIVSDKPLHELLLNLSVDLMLRSSDLLSLRVKDVINDSGSVKTEVKVKQKKTGKTTLSIPLSKNSIDAIKKHLVDKEQEDYIFKGQIGHFYEETYLFPTICKDSKGVDEEIRCRGCITIFNPLITKD